MVSLVNRFLPQSSVSGDWLFSRRSYQKSYNRHVIFRWSPDVICRRHDIDDFTIAIDNCALSGKRHSTLNLQLFAGGNDALVLYIDYLSLASRNPSAITAVIYHFPPPLTPSQLKKIDPFYYRQWDFCLWGVWFCPPIGSRRDQAGGHLGKRELDSRRRRGR